MFVFYSLILGHNDHRRYTTKTYFRPGPRPVWKSLPSRSGGPDEVRSVRDGPETSGKSNTDKIKNTEAGVKQ